MRSRWIPVEQPNQQQKGENQRCWSIYLELFIQFEKYKKYEAENYWSEYIDTCVTRCLIQFVKQKVRAPFKRDPFCIWRSIPKNIIIRYISIFAYKFSGGKMPEKIVIFNFMRGHRKNQYHKNQIRTPDYVFVFNCKWFGLAIFFLQN